MGDITGNRIGARLDDMEMLRSSLEATGRQMADHAAQSAARSGQLRAEVSELTGRLVIEFEALAASLGEMVSRSSAAMEAVDWDGRARAAAEEANTRFAVEVDSVLVRSREGAERLRQTLTGHLEAFHDEISGSFAEVLHRLDDSYRALALGTADHAARLADQDAAAMRGL
jgi:hypothetical protein